MTAALGPACLHTIAGQTVRLDHFPYKPDPRYNFNYARWRPEDDGRWLLHGHIHEKWRQQHRQINVGVDAWHFTPVPEQTQYCRVAANECKFPWSIP